MELDPWERFLDPASSVFIGAEEHQPTVLASRPLENWGELQSQVVRSDAFVAELLLGFMRETAAARSDEVRLLEVIAKFAFQAFPEATHHVLVARHEYSGEMRPLVARSRSGDRPLVALSRTIVGRVLDERCALLFSRGQPQVDASHSVMMSRLETAICAPLMGSRFPFGIIQLDIRSPGKGRFTRADVDLLSVFAGQVGLALEHLRLAKQQRRALHSTINALMYSLTLKDPEAAHHSERVQAISLELGRRLGLSIPEMESLSVAAILHDLGKQGVRDEVLFKPGRLNEAESAEMAQHAEHTQSILDMIEYPEELRDVPQIAAYHHEKLDGTGPFGIEGSEIPVQTRIISVADVFDALVSPRVYKDPLSPPMAIDILQKGRDRDWDGGVIDALTASLPAVMKTIYAAAPSGAANPATPAAPASGAEPDKAAAKPPASRRRPPPHSKAA
jgi:HD domain-containing protein/GAF domain-containing protein